MADKSFTLTAPCPECGNTKGLQVFGLGKDWWITCPECDYQSNGGKTLEEAVEDWNRRDGDG